MGTITATRVRRNKRKEKTKQAGRQTKKKEEPTENKLNCKGYLL